VEEEVTARAGSGGAEESAEAALGLLLPAPDAAGDQRALDAERRLLRTQGVDQAIGAEQAPARPALALGGLELVPTATRHVSFFGAKGLAPFVLAQR
jgi:hypothetical protein